MEYRDPCGAIWLPTRLVWLSMVPVLFIINVLPPVLIFWVDAIAVVIIITPFWEWHYEERKLVDVKTCTG